MSTVSIQLLLDEIMLLNSIADYTGCQSYFEGRTSNVGTRYIFKRTSEPPTAPLNIRQLSLTAFPVTLVFDRYVIFFFLSSYCSCLVQDLLVGRDCRSGASVISETHCGCEGYRNGPENFDCHELGICGPVWSSFSAATRWQWLGNVRMRLIWQHAPVCSEHYTESGMF